MFCNTCWANLPDGTERCPKCGNDPRKRVTKVGPAPPRRARPPEKVSEPTPFFSRPSVSIILLLIIFGGVYYLYRVRDRETLHKNPSPAATVTSPVSTFPERSTPKKPLTVAAPSQDLPSPDTRAPYMMEAKEAFERGDLRGAVNILRDALGDSPEDEDIKRFLSVSLNNLAVEEMKQNNLPEAERLLEEAVSLDHDPRRLKNLAVIKVKMGRIEEALDVLEPIADDGGAGDILKVIYRRLGERYYREGRIERALDAYKRLLELDPRDPSAKAMVKRLDTEGSVESGFRSREGSHFIVKFEGGENAEIGEIVSLILEEAYIKVGADLGYYPEQTIGAVLYSDEQFRDITKSPSWTGAIYDGRIKIPVGGITEKTDLLTKVIFHEYTHAVVHMVAVGRAPAWLNEGLAQYEEGRRSGPFASLLRDAAERGKISLGALNTTFVRLGVEEARDAYLYSLSATEYIIREFGLGSVMRILEGLGRGLSIDEALSEAIFMSYNDFEGVWLDSLKG